MARARTGAMSTGAQFAGGLIDPDELPTDGSPVSVEIRKQIGKPVEDAILPSAAVLEKCQWQCENFNGRSGEWEFVGVMSERPTAADIQAEFPGRLGRYRLTPLVDGDDGRKRPVVQRVQYVTIATAMPAAEVTRPASAHVPPGLEQNPMLMWMFQQQAAAQERAERAATEARADSAAQAARLEELRLNADESERVRRQEHHDAMMALLQKERAPASPFGFDENSLIGKAMLAKFLREPVQQDPLVAVQHAVALRAAVDRLAPKTETVQALAPEPDLVDSALKLMMPLLIARFVGAPPQAATAVPPPTPAAPLSAPLPVPQLAPPAAARGQDAGAAVIADPATLADAIERDPTAAKAAMQWLAEHRPQATAALFGLDGSTAGSQTAAPADPAPSGPAGRPRNRG